MIDYPLPVLMISLGVAIEVDTLAFCNQRLPMASQFHDAEVFILFNVPVHEDDHMKVVAPVGSIFKLPDVACHREALPHPPKPLGKV